MAPSTVFDKAPPPQFDDHQHDNTDQLPTYSISDNAAGPPPDFQGVAGLSAQTQNLSLGSIDPTSPRPTRDQVAAHLKFIHAVHTLRLSISAQDGLFNLNDRDVRDVKIAGQADELQKLLCEKRWAVYVARAVERFTAWFNVLKGRVSTRGAAMADFEVPGRLDEWVVNGTPEGVVRTVDQLPPIDVLMVWHSFMLNPRAYLEDCAMEGMMRLWHNGMPWSAIDACTDLVTGYYSPGENARQAWEASTGLAWINSLDPAEVEVTCPYCMENSGHRNTIVVPWTTYDIRNARLEAGKLQVSPGHGCADADFEATCTKCREKTTHTKLRAAKFTQDVRRLLYGDRRLLAGTVLDIDGQLTSSNIRDPHRIEHLFANFLMPEVVRMTAKGAPIWKSIADVRIDIETTLRDPNASMTASTSVKPGSRVAHLSRTERIMVRRLLSRYWDNSSPFALDLVGAVIRQGTFIEKMYRIDWLHSPAATFTIDTLLIKYARFMQLLIEDFLQMLVPTLDVDLGWHTHQLSPARYYAYTTALEGPVPFDYRLDKNPQYFRPGFIDHDDKIEESKLSDGFAKTSDMYQRKYKEPYSLCTCWYCESVRAGADGHKIEDAREKVKTKTSIFHRHKHAPPPVDPAAEANAAADEAMKATIEKALFNPYKPAPANPETGPHISAHNAVRPIVSDRTQTTINLNFAEQAKDVEKARKHAAKKGRSFAAPPAPGSTSTPADAAVAKAYPYTPAPFLTNANIHSEAYPAGPLHADYRLRGHANCAMGTCGGQVGVGSCGMFSSASSCANGAAAGCGTASGNPRSRAGFMASGLGDGGGFSSIGTI